MNFVELTRENEFFKNQINEKIAKVRSSGVFFFGQQTNDLETYFSKITKKKNCTSVKNCTDAIVMVLKFLFTRMEKENTPVIVPNFGAFPTAIAAANVTSNIVFVDVDHTMTKDVSKLLKNTKNGIIIPVHLFGNKCDMKSIMSYAKENNHIVIEDCAQSIPDNTGAEGDYSVFSFYPTKPIGCMGDGGMICTNNADPYSSIRFYGQSSKRDIDSIGVNSRIEEIQAAIINAKIQTEDNYLFLRQRRENIAKCYLEIVDGISWRECPSYDIFPSMFENRDEIIKL